ncbi:ROK family transcriptional regulator [Domibacillus sp. 8LH]|uniref:ROK family transcriptional regulator n=1 Tax=Domibacillus sp. 8LH TaxID=3073900 RepID=UPI0031759342
MSEMFATPKSMKKVILYRIRKALLEMGGATKAELSEKLNISFPTISKFLTQMEKDGELKLLGLDDSSGGRRAKRYAYNPEFRLGLAIFLEREETHYTIFNCLGEIKKQGKAGSVLAGGLPMLTACIENIMRQYPKIRAIAIGVPGSVENGRVFFIPGYEQFQQVDLKEYYETHFSIPVVVENDMNAAVLGYQREKTTQTNLSLVYLYFGQNGPGAGILVNGNIVRGSTFFSGEVSFVPQYDHRNFQEALGTNCSSGYSGQQVDAISRLAAAFVSILNPHTIIFCEEEADEALMEQILAQTAKYVPAEHLPELIVSDLKQDYLYGLQSLGLDLIINETGMPSM